MRDRAACSVGEPRSSFTQRYAFSFDHWYDLVEGFEFFLDFNYVLWVMLIELVTKRYGAASPALHCNLRQ